MVQWLKVCSCKYYMVLTVLGIKIPRVNGVTKFEKTMTTEIHSSPDSLCALPQGRTHHNEKPVHCN